MAKIRDWIDAILASKVTVVAMVILALVYFISRIDSFEELFVTLSSCLIAAIAIGFINMRRTKRGQSPLGWWPVFIIALVATGGVDILT